MKLKKLVAAAGVSDHAAAAMALQRLEKRLTRAKLTANSRSECARC